jgi:glutathione peroxidase-family protein
MTADLARVYAISVDDHLGNATTLAEHRGQVMLIVNTASY